MNCPVCSVELKMSERQGVEIDYCPQCRGVWLDRGEIDKIVERSVAVPSASRPDERPYYQRGHDEHDRHDQHDWKGRKRKGLLGDIFDF